MNRLIRAGVLAAVLAAAAPLALAQTPPAPADAQFAATTLDLAAYGEVQAAPDMATISLGVTTQAPTAAQAMADNARAMTAVLSALKAGGIADKQIQTANLTLEPQYVYVQNQPPRLNGYQASNQVTVTVLDLSRLGAAVDAVTGAGATNVSSISFGLKSRTPAENAARLAAVKALQDKAALYADATGYHIRRLVNLAEGTSYQVAPPRPMVRAMVAQAAPVTPVEAGQLTVRVDVSGEFELTH
ncbi:MAG: SIMPL domain-containing protein [Caulobacterales bacterium]